MSTAFVCAAGPCYRPEMLLPLRLMPLSLVLSSSLVFAQVLAVSAPPKLDLLTSQQFDKELARVRTEFPAAFSGVRSVVGRADALDAKRRGRFFPMTTVLRDVARASQGHSGAALAFLEPVLHPERFSMPVKASALTALRAGLIEASGDLKDPLAAPSYRALVQQGTAFYDVRAATEALGKLGLDEDVAFLARLATTPGASQDAVLAGLGTCRRLGAVTALADVAASQPPAARGALVVTSLGRLASSWALAIPNAAPASELEALRRTAARGALAVFVDTTDSALRDSASDALMGIDAPETPALIATARAAANGEVQARLEALQHRFERNPARGAR